MVTIILALLIGLPLCYKGGMKKWQFSKLIAHRGAAAYAPENTLAALHKAHDLGATWVEADVRLTRDGEPVILHDAKLNRTTNGRGTVAKIPYSIIADLDAGSWFGDEFANERVPSLNQWLMAAGELRCGIVLDLKASRFRCKPLVEQVSAALARYWPDDLPTPLISSESIHCLKALHNQKMHWPSAYITSKERGDWKKAVEEFGCQSLHIDHHFLSQRWIKQIKDRGLYIAAYTINDRERALQLFDWGIDSIFSDDPQLLKGGVGH